MGGLKRRPRPRFALPTSRLRFALGKAGFVTLLDFSTLDFPSLLSGVLTTRSFIRSDRETVMNFMRGLADGMDFIAMRKIRTESFASSENTINPTTCEELGVRGAGFT